MTPWQDFKRRPLRAARVAETPEAARALAKTFAREGCVVRVLERELSGGFADVTVYLVVARGPVPTKETGAGKPVSSRRDVNRARAAGG